MKEEKYRETSGLKQIQLSQEEIMDIMMNEVEESAGRTDTILSQENGISTAIELLQNNVEEGISIENQDVQLSQEEIMNILNLDVEELPTSPNNRDNPGAKDQAATIAMILQRLISMEIS